MSATFTTRVASNGTDIHVYVDGWHLETITWNDGVYVDRYGQSYTTTGEALVMIARSAA